MSGQDGGLTLEALTQRLETLEIENAALRDKVAALEGSAKRRTVRRYAYLREDLLEWLRSR